MFFKMLLQCVIFLMTIKTIISVTLFEADFLSEINLTVMTKFFFKFNISHLLVSQDSNVSVRHTGHSFILF